MTEHLVTLTLDEFRRKAAANQRSRNDARRDYERYCVEEADADRNYRQILAQAFAREKSSGASVAESELAAHSYASDAKHSRDLAKSMAKSALLRIESLEADRATLRSVATWSQAIDSTGAGVAS